MKRHLKLENARLPARRGKWKIIILVGIASLLAVAIFNQQKTKLSQNNSASSPAPSIQPKLLPSNLTDDEKFILFPPSVDASKSAKEKHAQIVAKLAKMGDSIEIKDCQPTPLVLQVKQGSKFTIKNGDTTSHNIVIDEEHQYKIPANGNLEIVAQFKYSTGDYGYICEGVGLTGFLHVAP